MTAVPVNPRALTDPTLRARGRASAPSPRRERQTERFYRLQAAKAGIEAQLTRCSFDGYEVATAMTVGGNSVIRWISDGRHEEIEDDGWDNWVWCVYYNAARTASTRRRTAQAVDEVVVASRHMGPPEVVAAVEIDAKVREAVALLQPHLRAAVEARFFNNLMPGEYAEYLDLPLSTYRNRLIKAFCELRRLLRPLSEDR